MTGFAFVYSPCFGCSRLFCYSPTRVPSVRSPFSGEKEPICLDCINRVNLKRIANGLKPIEPMPGAYEPVDESELSE